MPWLLGARLSSSVPIHGSGRDVRFSNRPSGVKHVRLHNQPPDSAVGVGSGLAADKKAVPGAGQAQQGQTLSVPLACSRTSGTCSCSGSQDCKDLQNAKLCDGEMSCQGGNRKYDDLLL